MNDTDLIAAYFEGNLSPAEKTAFEEKCEQDPGLAAAVAEYLLMRSALSSETADRKKREFDALYRELSASALQKKRGLALKMLPLYAAAACIALIAAWLLFFRQPDTEDLAQDYIAANLKTLSVHMGGQTDQSSLQQGIFAYNEGRYDVAIKHFRALEKDSLQRPEALKNLGLAHLAKADYPEAIATFDTLSRIELYSNPGLFYKALAHLRRGQDGDHDQAVKDLHEVVQKNLFGKQQAQAWLKELN